MGCEVERSVVNVVSGQWGWTKTAQGVGRAASGVHGAAGSATCFLTTAALSSLEKVPNKNSCLLSLPVEAFWCILSFLSNRAVCELRLVDKKCLKQSAKKFERQFKHLIIAHDEFGINKLEGVADKPAVAALVRKVTISRRLGRASSDGCRTLLSTLKHSLQQFRNIETVETDTATNPFIEPSY